MKKEEIHLYDIKRILLGQAPPEFLLETFLRTLIIYVALIFIIRILGKRMAGQLTITEMAVILTLGAIVAPPMQMPDHGLLLGMFILAGIAYLQRSLTYLNFKRPKTEQLTQGSLSVLVKDGVLDLPEMRKARVSHQQLFSSLRKSQVYSLGSVERVYLEACGMFSIFKNEQPKPGLSVIPPDDKQIFEEQQGREGLSSCTNCGFTTQNKKEGDVCKMCDHTHWEKAVI